MKVIHLLPIVAAIIAGTLVWALNGHPGVNQRMFAKYVPGDCLQTPVYDPETMERWELTKEPDDIIMITEVGNHSYLYRGWGLRRTGKPEWYTEYESREFKRFDDTSSWSLIQCPEQGPDPEVAEANIADTTGSRRTVVTVSTLSREPVSIDTFSSVTN